MDVSLQGTEGKLALAPSDRAAVTPRYSFGSIVFTQGRGAQWHEDMGPKGILKASREQLDQEQEINNFPL